MTTQDLKPQPMLVAFTGCWHADIVAARRALNFCRDNGVRVLIQTGDFLYDQPDASRVVQFVEDYIEINSLDIVIIGIRGNHDNPQMYFNLPPVTNLERLQTKFGITVLDAIDMNVPLRTISRNMVYAVDGTVLQIGDKSFGFCGGAYSVDRQYRKLNVSWWELEIPDIKAIEFLKTKSFDVLVSHEPPAGIEYNLPPNPYLDIANAELSRIPMGELLEAVKPSITVTGHMHLFLSRKFPFRTESTGDSEFLSVTLDHGHYRKAEKPVRETISDFIWTLEV